MGSREYYDKGRAFIREKDYEKAIEAFSAAIAMDEQEFPGRYGALASRASAYRHLKDYEKALADYTRMIEMAPQNTDGLNSRGNLYHTLGEYDKAIADFTQCIPLSPANYGTYWSNRGIAYYEKGDLDAALADFNTSIACWEYPESTSWALFNRGLVWKKKGDIEKALEDFTLAAARDPDSDDALYHAGVIWFERKEHDKAIECFSAAIAVREDVADYWLARGVCYWNKSIKDKTGFWGESGELMTQAEEDFGKAIECNGDMAEAYFNRGMVRYYKARDGNNLIKSITAQKATDDAQRVLLMAQLGHLGGQALIPQADALLRGLRSNRDMAEVLVAQMAGEFAEDDAREAIKDLSRCIALEPEKAAAYYERGLCYALLGEKDKALADYEQTCALDPLHANAAQKRDEIKASGAPGGPSLTTR